jgi:putative membrane protein
MNNDKQTKTEPQQDPRTYLAIERTMLAHDRTQLAWIRTIIGMMTAGLAIDKGFSALHQARLVTGEAWAKNGHFAGMFLTISGVVLILLTGFYYVKSTKQLSTMKGKKMQILNPVIILSLLVLIVGILALFFMNIA